jgi:membrane protease subunit HflK
VLYESRQQIAIEVRERMQQMLDRYGTGILVTTVAIQNAQPPEQVQAAFDDAVKAGQDRERQINEGQAYANDVVPKARGLASRLMQESEGYRTRVVESAQGDASRFRQILTEYQKAPTVTRDRMYIETMQQVFNNTTKVLVDSRQGNQLLYLPFDKLVQQAMQDSGAPRAAPAPVPEPPPVDPSRSRDTSLRSRDREAR